jgi:type IVB pilus formation R64 PilN family outer membrane protein
MKRTVKKTGAMLALSLAGLALQGCWISKPDMDARMDQTGRDIDKGAAKAMQNAPLLVEKSGAWLAGKEIPLESAMAPELKQKIALAASEPMGIQEIAQRITQATRIAVALEPDLFVKASSSASRAASAMPFPLPALPDSVSVPPTGMPDLPIPGAPGAATGISSPGMPSRYVGGSAGGDPLRTRITYSHNGPLDVFLDQITGQLGIAWEYKQGRVVLSRYKTRTFVLHLPADVREVSAEVGGESAGSDTALQGITAGGTGGGSGGGGAAVRSSEEVHQIVKADAKLDAWKEVSESIGRLLSPEGRFTTAPSSGEIVITDTPVAVARVADYIERKNANLTRQVAVQVDVLAVDADSSDQFEIDWNVIFKNSELGLAFVNPAMLKGPMTDLAMQILHPSSDFNGSSVAIKAISRAMKTRLVTSSIATTLNNHPAPVQVTRTDGYLKSIQSNVTGVTGVVSTALIPGQITTGFIMTVTPRILERDRLLLTYNIDLSRLLPFTNASVGTGDTAATIQIPNVERRAFMQAVTVRAGDTLMLSGFENADDRSDLSAPIHPDNSLFGSRSLQEKRAKLIILITPVITANGGV